MLSWFKVDLSGSDKDFLASIWYWTKKNVLMVKQSIMDDYWVLKSWIQRVRGSHLFSFWSSKKLTFNNIYSERVCVRITNKTNWNPEQQSIIMMHLRISNRPILHLGCQFQCIFNTKRKTWFAHFTNIWMGFG